MVNIRRAEYQDISEVVSWLKVAEAQDGTNFYCNSGVIAESFKTGEGLCAISEGKIVAFTVFSIYTDGGSIQIIEVEPSSRRQGIGSQLISATVEHLSALGANYVEVECVSAVGEALFRHHGFEDYVDPVNYRSEWDDPLLRLYLSEWRPKEHSPWA